MNSELKKVSFKYYRTEFLRPVISSYCSFPPFSFGLKKKNVRLLMYTLQLSIQLSNMDVLELEPKAAGETRKYHLTQLKALVCVFGQKEASA